MTLDQLQILNDDEKAIALYIINSVFKPEVPEMEFQPIHLTWFKHDVLVKKFLDAFPMLKPEGHTTYSSLLTKLGVQHEIKYETPPPPPPPPSTIS